jgi:hypothetical protein
MTQYILMTKTSNDTDWSIQLFLSLNNLLEELRLEIRHQYFMDVDIDWSIGCDELIDCIEEDFSYEVYLYDGKSTPLTINL